MSSGSTSSMLAEAPGAPEIGPAVLAVQPSTVPGAGLGLFAAEDIEPLTIIGEYTGEVKDLASYGAKVDRLGHSELHPFYLRPGLLVDPTDEHGCLHPESLRLWLESSCLYIALFLMAHSKRPGPEILGASKRARGADDGNDKASWLPLLGARLPPRELALATDCGGSVGPVSALSDLGVPFRHIFACESDPSSQQLLASQADSRPERLFGSMIGRDRGCYCLVSGRWMPMPKVEPDIYISNAGTHGPNPDRFFAAVKYIMEYQPRMVILEDLVAACRQEPIKKLGQST
eukprot:s4209_g7.t1